MQKGCQGKNDTRETVVRGALKNFVMPPSFVDVEQRGQQEREQPDLLAGGSSKESEARRRSPATECSAATFQQAESRHHQWEAHTSTRMTSMSTPETREPCSDNAYEEMEDAMPLTRSKANRSVWRRLHALTKLLSHQQADSRYSRWCVRRQK